MTSTCTRCHGEGMVEVEVDRYDDREGSVSHIVLVSCPRNCGN